MESAAHVRYLMAPDAAAAPMSGDTMPDHNPMTAVPRGLIHVPVTPFGPDNTLDLATFARVVEFLLEQNAAALCVNLHLAESLNLTLDERKALSQRAIEVTAGRDLASRHGSFE